MKNIEGRLRKLEGPRKREPHIVFVMPGESKEEVFRQRFGEAGPHDDDFILVMQFTAPPNEGRRMT